MLIDSKAKELWNEKLTRMQKMALAVACPYGYAIDNCGKRWELLTEEMRQKLKMLDWNFMLGGKLGDLSKFYRP